MTEQERLTQAYRNVFKGRDGQIVLADILHFTGFFSDEITTPEGAARRNVAQRILINLGCVDDGSGERSAEVCSALVKGLLSISLQKKKAEKEE